MSAESTAGERRWVPLDFRKAVVRPGAKGGSYVLTVSGDKPRDAKNGAAVKLQPMVHEIQPEYWRIEVLWEEDEAVLPIITPFTVSISLDGICGTKGIRVAGQTRFQKIDIG
jgi:hypothetical protein